VCDLDFSSSNAGHADALSLQVELLAPAVSGTMNVLKACSQAVVKRVVVVSSLSAVMVNPEWGDKAMDEGCWSDVDLCRTTEVRPTSPMLHLHEGTLA
jgi:nucleoside-diphosphate-sugar epimerase